MKPPDSRNGRAGRNGSVVAVWREGGTAVTAAMVPAEAVLRERDWAFQQGLRAFQQAGQDMLPLARRIWVSPRFADLLDQRQHLVTTRCGSRACRGCSRCARAAAVEKNRRVYGADDYPGRVNLAAAS